MNKYIINHQSSSIEFLSQTDANDYAVSIGVDTGSIEIAEFVTASVSADAIFEQKMADGYNIPNTPYYLAMADSDRAQFSGMLSLLNEALAAGYVQLSTPTMIRDKNYNSVNLTVGDFKSIMLGYGFYYKSIWDDREDPT